MYGLFVSNLASYIISNYGQNIWDEIRMYSNTDSPTLVLHQLYPDQLLDKLTKGTCRKIGTKKSILLENIGFHFVEYIGQFGYDKIMSRLGRNIVDFLNGLDNLHECLKFSYPKLQPPSYFCDNETENGFFLHYMSKR